MITVAEMSKSPDPGRRRRHGIAWVMLTITVALHIADEASFGFLSFYNPMVETIRAKVPFLIFPTFTFC